MITAQDVSAPSERFQNSRIQPRTARFYRPELDSLRFFAAFSVLVFHSFPKDIGFWISRGFPAPLAALVFSVIEAGGFGVDLFFFLSAFLITELLLREREQRGTVDVKAFYIRRILRIWPLYFFFIVLAFTITFVDKSQHIGSTYIISFLLLAGNWVIILSGDPSSVIMPLWSVSVEEQFYLIWPQVVRRLGKRGICALCAGMLLLSALSRFLLVRNHLEGNFIWCNTFARLDPIALGILFAFIARRYSFALSLRWRLLCLGVAAMLWLIVGRFANLHLPTASMTSVLLGYPIVAVGSMLFLIGTFRGPEHGLPFLSHRALTYLGQISYGIYVYHELGLLISRHVFGAYTKRAAGYAIYWAFAVTMTLLMAAVSYRVLEKPFLKLKERFTFIKSRPA